MGIDHLWTFLMTAVLFTMTPGLDTIFILNKSLVHGRKAGLYATLGINTGVLVHTMFAAAGVSLLVAQSALAFSLLKYAGALYLGYLGLTKLRSTTPLVATSAATSASSSGAKYFWSGVFTNVLNPKVALFFLAFFPQFVHPQSLTSPLPFLLLGACYALIGIIWFLLLTLFASYFAATLTTKPRLNDWLNKGSGIAFLLMGLKLAVTER